VPQFLTAGPSCASFSFEDFILCLVPSRGKTPLQAALCRVLPVAIVSRCRIAHRCAPKRHVVRMSAACVRQRADREGCEGTISTLGGFTTVRFTPRTINPPLPISTVS